MTTEKAVVVHANNAIFFGYLLSHEGKEVKLRGARNAYYWKCERGMLELSATGPQVGPIEKSAQTIMCSQILDPTSWNVSPDFHVEFIESDKLFDRLMASYEAKRKSLRDTRRRVIPPIGMTAMMEIAGKAMED